MFGVDFSKTFAPITRLDTTRMLLAIATQKGWRIYQLDVKSAFVNGYLEEEIFVEQPEGFYVNGKKDKVYLLKKALYGLKQAPRAWYSRIDAYLLTLGCQKSQSEFTLYIKKIKEDNLIVSLYVDNLLVTGNNVGLVNEFKVEMKQVLEMTDDSFPAAAVAMAPFDSRFDPRQRRHLIHAHLVSQLIRVQLVLLD